MLTLLDNQCMVTDLKTLKTSIRHEKEIFQFFDPYIRQVTKHYLKQNYSTRWSVCRKYAKQHVRELVMRAA